MSTTATKKEFTLKQVFTMWIYKSKNGDKYLSGKTEDGQKIRGFFNNKKENPKEPDIRIYLVNDKGDLSKEEYVSLWCNAKENGKRHLSGKIDGKRVVGFFNSKAKVDGVIPYFSVYWSEANEDSKPDHKETKTETKKATKSKKAEKKEEPETDSDLPF